MGKNTVQKLLKKETPLILSFKRRVFGQINNLRIFSGTRCNNFIPFKKGVLKLARYITINHSIVPSQASIYFKSKFPHRY